MAGFEAPNDTINAGTKQDFTAKGWGTHHYQELVDRLEGKIQFVQVGEAGHLHQPLRGVIDLLGKTDVRQFIRLAWNAKGGVGPSTFLQHVLAAFDKPYVCLAGGREPIFWQTYPKQTLLHSIGKLSCCADRACWKSRVVPLGDGGEQDKSLCEQPIWTDGSAVPRCLDMIRPEQVAVAVLSYCQRAPKTF